jgi:hypothetical protein
MFYGWILMIHSPFQREGTQHPHMILHTGSPGMVLYVTNIFAISYGWSGQVQVRWILK